MRDFAQLGRQVAHTPEARAMEGAKQRRHALARSSWDESQQTAWLTKKFYLRKIKPSKTAPACSSPFVMGRVTTNSLANEEVLSSEN
jgi:hypothetical protein